jgi:dihydroflavonol-4-reductase
LIILVTGSTGFIGSHLCRALVGRGHDVRAFHRPSSSTLALDGLAVEHAVGDVLDSDSLRRAMAGVDLVFHAAARVAHWREGAAIIETTVAGTSNVLKASQAANVGRIVYTSSVAALGVPQNRELLNEASLFNYPPKRWPYGYAKHVAEKEVLEAARDGLDCIIVNPATVFGAGDLNLISGALVVEVARGRVPVTTSGGMNVVHISDVVEGHLAAAEYGRRGERYILGGENLPHSEIIRAISVEVGVRPPRVELPPALVGMAAPVVDLVGPLLRLPFNGNLLRLSTRFFYCDTSKAHEELGLPGPRPFSQAIHEAVAWYREHGYLR